jgi:hypothetical protein
LTTTRIEDKQSYARRGNSDGKQHGASVPRDRKNPGVGIERKIGDEDRRGGIVSHDTASDHPKLICVLAECELRSGQIRGTEIAGRHHPQLHHARQNRRPEHGRERQHAHR